MTGDRYGRLTVIAVSGAVSSGKVAWLCVCDCGTSRTVRGGDLRSGRTLSCGCLNAEKTGNRFRKHGARQTPEYSSWSAMHTRVGNPNFKQYADYGGRGISICDRWFEFDNFLADMGPRPSLHHSIERIDGNGNYEPSNCEWADRKTQNRNRRSNRLVTYNGVDMTVAEAAEKTGLSAQLIYDRLNLGWSSEAALSLPVHAKR